MARRRAEVPADEAGSAGPREWPGWARAAATFVILFHATAVVGAAMAASPASALQVEIAELFKWYNRLVDQGYSYRYYVGGAPPTPILLAELDYGDGRVDRLRIPDRSMQPRLRYQRHLALAYHLAQDVHLAEDFGQQSRWAASYARHLCRSNPGVRRVTMMLTDHRNPSPMELIEAAQEGRVLDVESESYYSPARRIGVFSCD